MKNDISDKKQHGGLRPGSGRKPMGLESTLLRLPAGTLARLDATLSDGERRADALRAAVEREIAARGG